MKYYVAPSYENYRIVSVDEDAKKAVVEGQCDRCGGSGMYIIPRVFQGTCFTCGGAGVIRKRVKVYTPDEYEKYLARIINYFHQLYQTDEITWLKTN